MGQADLHIHSQYSWDSTSPIPNILEYAAQTAKLDVVAITDHNQIDGALEALELAPDYGLEVIPGCEISTSEGHLLALFITQPVPAGMNLADTIQAVGKMGGLCVAPHPMAGRVSDSLSATAIQQALRQPSARRILVGLEAYNAGNVGWLYKGSNSRARLLASALSLAQLGGSDAHMISAIGQGKTSFPGQTAADFRQALLQRKVRPVQGKTFTAPQVLGHWLIGTILRTTGLTSLAGLFGLL